MPQITLINGATIAFKSGDNPDSLYGEDVYAAVIDEASRVKEESWHALRSTLTATQGPVRVIGNVKGRKNWFYRLARLAEGGSRANMRYERITVLDAIAAGVIPESEVEDARATLPEHVFRELYMAEPSDDGGNPFGLQHIAACVVPSLSAKPAVAFGIDLAKKQDYFVVIGLDEDGSVCVFDRWQGLSWPQSIRRVHAHVGEDVPALIDSTGVGDPVLDEFQEDHGNFHGYQFTNVSKQKLMEGLSVAIQRHEITFPSGVLVDELENFEYVVSASGRVFYSAPEGLHDDCVCALALARQQWAETAPGANLMAYYAAQAERAKRETAVVPAANALPSTFNKPTSAEVLDNELTQLYRQTLTQYTPAARVCFRCGLDVGPQRVSDGIYIWHPSCAGLVAV